MELALATSALSVTVAMGALAGLTPLARHVDLVDMPDHRKQHHGAVPLTGGLSVFLGLLVAWLAVMPFSQGYGVFFLCAFILVLVGSVDDARDIPAKFRLGVQIALGAVLSLGSGVYLTGFGNLFGFGDIGFGGLGPVVTICAVIAATNMYNMMDGIDGLAGSMALVTLLGLLVLFMASPAAFSPEVTFSLALCLGLIPYLMANLRVRPFRRRIFLGDAGALFLGFAIVWLLTKGVEAAQPAFRPVTALWLVALPLMDMAAIMIRRARRGESVMKPDREHLHHIFMRAGFSDRQALALITLAAVVMAAIGLAGEWLAVPEWVMLSGFLLVFAGYYQLLTHAWRVLVTMRRHLAE